MSVSRAAGSVFHYTRWFEHMQRFSASPGEIVKSTWRHWALLKALVKREVIGRYRGSSLGILWSLFHPLLMLAVYTVVFSVIFKARWSAGSDSKTEFALVLFAGMLVFNLFSECVNRAPTLILSNANYVKKVIFPLEILPCVGIGSALFHFLVGLAVWLAFYIATVGAPHLTVVYLPFVMVPLVLFTLGISWLLASMAVFLRDIGQAIGIVTTVLMFLSPIFYPVSALPERYRIFLMLNPLSPAIEETRNVLYWGRAPDWSMIGISMVVATLVAWLGFAWFQKTRKGFADVL